MGYYRSKIIKFVHGLVITNNSFYLYIFCIYIYIFITTFSNNHSLMLLIKIYKMSSLI